MVQGRGGTRRGWQTELSHIIVQTPRSFFSVDQSTGMTPPHNIFQPFFKKNFSLLSTTICSYEKKLDLQSLLLILLLQIVDIVVLII